MKRKNPLSVKFLLSLVIVCTGLIFSPTFSYAAVLIFNAQSDGWTEAGGSNWSMIQSASSSNVVANDSTIYNENKVGGFKWFDNYYIERLHLVFDTISLPEGAIVDNVGLVINVIDGHFNASTTGVNVVYSSQSEEIVTINSYGEVGDVSLGDIKIPNIGEYSINLVEESLSEILKSGEIKLAVRSWHDFNNIEPDAEVGSGLDGDSLHLGSLEQNINQAPKLVVEYHMPVIEPPIDPVCKEKRNEKNKECKPKKPTRESYSN